MTRLHPTFARRPPDLRSFAVALPALLSISCAGAAASNAGASAPRSASESQVSFTSLDDAQRAFSNAERDLFSATIHQPGYPVAGNAQNGYGQPSAATGSLPAPAGTVATPPTVAPPSAAPPPASTPVQPSPAQRQADASPDKPAEKADEAKPAREAQSPCAIACRAFSSMKNAADAICRLAGETDTRCTDARKRLADSTARITSCTCDAP